LRIDFDHSKRAAISRSVMAAAVIVVIIVAGVGIYYVSTTTKTSSTSTTPSTSTTSPTVSKQLVKIAILLPGERNDESWNQLGYQSFLSFVKNLNSSGKYIVKTSVVEGAYTTADITPAMQSFASEGYDFIIGYGFQDQPPATQVAPQYPHIGFLVADGYAPGANLGVASDNAGQQGFLDGVLAALMTKTGKVALIGGVSAGELVWADIGFRLGVNYTDQNFNKHVTYTVTYVGNFNDPAAATSAAATAVSEGAGVLFCTNGGTDTEGVAAEAVTANVPTIYSFFNATNLAPGQTLGGTTLNWNVAFTDAFNDWTTTHSFNSTAYWATFGNGGYALSVNPNLVPANDSAVLNTLKNNIISNKLIIYNLLSNGTLVYAPVLPAYSSLSPSG